MFHNLTQSLVKIFDKIRSTGLLTESQIDAVMRDTRVALLEADVALPVVKEFITRVKERALGQKVIASVSPGQLIIKIINDEMVQILSSTPEESHLNLNSNPPVSILVAGLQGSGKTTASAKLALLLKQQNKKVLLVSLDTYRPAAQEQLAILAGSIGVDSLDIVAVQDPLSIAVRGQQQAKLAGYDVVIYDSAGRLHIDETMIDEIVAIKNLLNPTEILLVIDSMIGQDALNVAGVFDQRLTITGFILSRVDGDARGGVALSVRYTTGKPIKFLSTGEKLSDFEIFDAVRITNRILDMGDIVALVEKASSMLDQTEAEKAAVKLKKGSFDLNDYKSQIKMIKKMGGIGNLVGMLPGMSKLTQGFDQSRLNDKVFIHQEAIILSMTHKERANPSILNASRKKRIANGSGTTVQQVNSLLKQFLQISSMMKKVSKISPASLMRSGVSKFFS